MYNIFDGLPRDMTRAEWARTRAMFRKHGFWREYVEKQGPDRLQERETLQFSLEYFADGRRTVPVKVWSRDCDMCESTTLRTIPATPMAYDRFCDREYEWAEGPVSIRLLTLEEAEEFTPEFRDRIAEAWDNGNTSPHYV